MRDHARQQAIRKTGIQGACRFAPHRIAAAVAAVITQLGLHRSGASAPAFKYQATRATARHWGAALLAGSCLSPVGVAAQSWIGGNGTLFGTVANWDSGSVPGAGQTAIFGNSTHTAVAFDTTGIGGMEFTPGASAYTFDVPFGTSIGLAGINNASAQTQTFNIGNSVGDLSVNGGTLNNLVFNLDFLSSLGLNGAASLGNASVNMTGSAELYLNDSSSGGTAAVSGTGGTLFINNLTPETTVGSVAGAVNISLGARTLKVGGNGASTTMTGEIQGGAGGGAIVKEGNGTWTLTSTSNDYDGGTTINGGAISISNNGSLGNAAGTLAFGAAASTTLTHSGAIDGTGALTKTGAGTLSLTGTNSYQGGTTINDGTLGVSGNSNLGDAAGGLTFNGGTLQIQGLGFVSARAITLNAGGGTVDTNSNNATLTGDLSGVGALTKTGTGTMILSGANNYSGGTTVNGGTLQGSTTSLQGNITNNATVVFDQTAAGTYAGAMSGNGAFRKTGTGNLILTGTNTYTGATTISGGTLSVNGSITSPVTVNSGGALGGSGTINGAVSVASGGIFAPGNSIGTITVNGNLSFASGSIYRVEVDAAGNADRINVTGAPGTAALNGTVDVQAGAGTYAANTQYTILHATGGRTGNFAGVTSNLAFLTPTLGYDAHNVFLTLTRNATSFASVAITPNQIATSTALQNAGNTGEMGVIQTALTGLSAEQARAAYDSASGAGLVALRNAGASFAAGLGRQLQARLGAVGGASSTQVGAFAGGPILLAANDRVSDLMAPVSDSSQKFSLAGGSSSSSSSSSSQGRGFWLRGSGAQQNTRSDGNAAASELRNSSISAGFDAEVRDGLVLGAALSSGTARLGFDNADTGKSRGSAIALYGSYTSGPWAFKGSASAAWASNQMDRAVTMGAINRRASSDFDSNTLSAYGEATYSMPMNSWTLQPLAGLAFSRHKASGFTETGAGALNLQVAGETTHSAKSMLGAKASFDAGSVRLEPRLIWAHEFGDLNTPMTAQFQGAATASPFQVAGVALKRDTLILGLGASGRVGQGVELFADVQAEHNSRQNKLAVLAGLRARW